MFDGRPVEDDDAATPGFQYQGITYDLDTQYFTASVEYRDYYTQDLMLNIVMCDKTWKPLTQQSSTIDIVNRSTPTATSAPLQGRVILDHRKWRIGDRFLFSVNASGTTTSDGQTYHVEAPLPSNVVRASDGVGRFSIGTGGTGGIEPCTAAMNGTQNYCDFTFGNIGFTIPGTYTYTIAQAWENGTTIPSSGATSANGVTYSQAVYSVTFTVAETSAGTLAVSDPSITVNPGTSGDAAASDGRMVWTNRYQPSLSGDTAIGVSTTIIGRAWQSTDSFTYTLAALDGAPLPSGTPPDATSATVRVTNTTKNHRTTFPDITFPAAGTYRYVLTQNDAGMRSGLLQSAAAFLVTVTVADDGDGTLTATMNLSRTTDDEGDAVAEGGQNVSGTVADFSNRFLRVVALPSAGGWHQTRPFLGAAAMAAMLAASALAVCAVSAIRRRCMRHEKPPGSQDDTSICPDEREHN